MSAHVGQRRAAFPLNYGKCGSDLETYDGIETKKFSYDLIDFILQSSVDCAKITLKKGQYVYYQEDIDENFYLVVDGYVEILALNDLGQETIIDIVGPGALCGEGAAFDGQARATTARTLMTAQLIRLSANKIMSCFGEHPQLARLLIRAISAKQRVLLERLTQVTQLPAHDRVLRLLVQIGSNSDEQLVAISHEKLANLIGLTRVTVTRAIGKLCESGAISKRDGKIYINSKLAAPQHQELAL